MKMGGRAQSQGGKREAEWPTQESQSGDSPFATAMRMAGGGGPSDGGLCQLAGLVFTSQTTPAAAPPGQRPREDAPTWSGCKATTPPCFPKRRCALTMEHLFREATPGLQETENKKKKACSEIGD